MNYVATAILVWSGPCYGFQIIPRLKSRSSTSFGCLSAKLDRRDFLAGSLVGIGSFSFPAVSNADDDSLVSQMFNADGSLKEGVKIEEAKDRKVSFEWDDSDSAKVYTDGSSTSEASTPGSTKVSLSYKLPEKWVAKGDDLYIDTSEGVNAKAMNHVYIYQATGSYTKKQLDKATMVGVGKALNVIQELDGVRRGDIVGGKKISRGADADQEYYEFDVAVAPKTCGESSENLGLGFCPYERIFLLSATLLGEKLYVIAIESDDKMWKQANVN